eukprot:3823200-Pleurochrysis_carterae.AAC.1
MCVCECVIEREGGREPEREQEWRERRKLTGEMKDKKGSAMEMERKESGDRDSCRGVAARLPGTFPAATSKQLRIHRLVCILLLGRVRAPSVVRQRARCFKCWPRVTCAVTSVAGARDRPRAAILQNCVWQGCRVAAFGGGDVHARLSFILTHKLTSPRSHNGCLEKRRGRSFFSTRSGRKRLECHTRCVASRGFVRFVAGDHPAPERAQAQGNALLGRAASLLQRHRR